MTDEYDDGLMERMARLYSVHGGSIADSMRAALKLLPKPEVKVTEEMIERARAAYIKAAPLRDILEAALIPPPQVPEPTGEEIDTLCRFLNWPCLDNEKAAARVLKAVRKMDLERGK